MPLKSLMKNVKAALGANSNSKRGRRSRRSSAPLPHISVPKRYGSDLSSRTERTVKLDGEDSSSHFQQDLLTPSTECFRHAFFRNELMHLRQNKTIRRVTLQDFVQRYERDDILALHDILTNHQRKWKVIKFQDTIEGANYRRWVFKKENLRRALEQSCVDQEEVPVVFEEHIKIDMDDMPGSKIAALLKDIERDTHVCALSFDGFLNHQDVDSVVKSLVQLLAADGRRWKKIVIRCSFDGEEFDEWVNQVGKAKRQLENLAIQFGIPIFMKVC